MAKIKHKSYKNPGILFELLLRKIASDVISNKDSIAVNITKKYFNNTEIAKEHKLYQSLINAKLNESRAEALISSVLDLSKKLNKTQLKHDKYNLLKEIKENYNNEEFFKTKINHYKEYASIYNLLEAHNSKDFIEPSQVIENKCTLLEHISKNNVDKEVVKDNVLEEYVSMDKGTRLLTYKILVDKFNKKYSSLMPEQKQVLKEYINSISNNPRLKDFINEQFSLIKKRLKTLSFKIEDPTVKIKLNEVLTFLTPLEKDVKDQDILNVLQNWQLIKELELIKNK